MPKYLTPQAVRRFDDGVPQLASLSDALLARTIQRAEAAIDAYVGFDLKAGGFEPHVIGMIQQGFDMTEGFAARKLRIPSPLVPIRNLTRIQIHISNTGTGGQALVAILSPGEVVINNWQGYCEVIALTLTYSLSAVIWELGTNPPIAEWDCTVGFYNPVYGEQLYDNGDGKTFYGLNQFWASTYQQASSNQPFQAPPVPPNVYVNGALQNGGYSVNYTEGSVTFGFLSPGSIVTADYTAQIPPLVQEACLEQVTYILTQRALNLGGAGGVEQVKNADQFIRRSRTDDTDEDGLCAKARMKLAGYKMIAVG